MIRSVCAWIAVVGIGAPLWAADVDPDPKSLEVPAKIDRKARQLIRALADRSYSEREQANRELKELGRMALPAIRDAFANSSNPEIQLRCETVLTHATAEDIRARVDCFLADVKGEFDHKLPGAKAYFAIAGKSDASRTLFREMILSPNQAMLMAIGGSPDEIAKAVDARRSQFRPNYGSYIGTGRPTLKSLDIAALLFAESCVSEKLLSRNSSLASQLLNSPELPTALQSGAAKETYFALMTKWIDTREEALTLYYAINTSTNLKLIPTGMKCAKKLLEMKTAAASYRGMAMTFLAKNGGPDQVEWLEAVFPEKTVLITTVIVGQPGANKRVVVQTRDAALALCVILGKKDPTEFGMTARSKNTNDAVRMNYSQHCFDDTDGDAEEKREAAFAKYREWRAAEKKKK